MYQPKTGQDCSCRKGMERDNCPSCEGTGQRIDFNEIRKHVHEFIMGPRKKAAVCRCGAFKHGPANTNPVITEQVQTIDITPTWSGLLSVLIDLAHNENPEARQTAREELAKMAKAADLYNASLDRKGVKK